MTHAVDISENLIICYLDIYANGTVWKLHYGNQGLQRTFSIGEQSYKLPLEGAPDSAMANPYPGQRTVGSDYLNGGIPFVIFGGSKVEGQARHHQDELTIHKSYSHNRPVVAVSLIIE